MFHKTSSTNPEFLHPYQAAPFLSSELWLPKNSDTIALVLRQNSCFGWRKRIMESSDLGCLIYLKASVASKFQNISHISAKPKDPSKHNRECNEQFSISV